MNRKTKSLRQERRRWAQNQACGSVGKLWRCRYRFYAPHVACAAPALFGLVALPGSEFISPRCTVHLSARHGLAPPLWLSKCPVILESLETAQINCCYERLESRSIAWVGAPIDSVGGISSRVELTLTSQARERETRDSQNKNTLENAQNAPGRGCAIDYYIKIVSFSDFFIARARCDSMYITDPCAPSHHPYGKKTKPTHTKTGSQKKAFETLLCFGGPSAPRGECQQ